MNTYWISLPCDLLSSLASFQCSLLHHLHLSSDLGLSKYVNQHSHLNLSRNVRLPVLYDLDFNISNKHTCLSSVIQLGSHFLAFMYGNHCHFSKCSQTSSIFCIFPIEQCMRGFCSFWPYHYVIQFCCCGNDLTPEFSFVF